MDEAGRCRRTDGKRWRCSKAVVPNEKYCEKHMHRGCRRSRRLVESSTIASPDLLKSEGRRGNNDRTTKITFKPQEKHDKKSSNGKVEEERLKKVTKRNTQGLEFCPKSVLGEGVVSASIRATPNQYQQQQQMSRSAGDVEEQMGKGGHVPPKSLPAITSTVPSTCTEVQRSASS